MWIYGFLKSCHGNPIIDTVTIHYHDFFLFRNIVESGVKHQKNQSSYFSKINRCELKHLHFFGKQELPEHLSSLPVVNRVHVAQSLISCVVFCTSSCVLLSFFFWSFYYLSFNLRGLITSLWYLQTFLEWTCFMK